MREGIYSFVPLGGAVTVLRYFSIFPVFCFVLDMRDVAEVTSCGKDRNFTSERARASYRERQLRFIAQPSIDTGNRHQVRHSLTWIDARYIIWGKEGC